MRTLVVHWRPALIYVDTQSSSTDGTYYHLADDRNDVEAPQRWDQELKDFCAYNTAHSSCDRVLDGI
jgi:hypothetical protein